MSKTGGRRRSAYFGTSVLLGALLCAPAGAAVGAWKPVGPPDGATVQALAVSPSNPTVVYAGLVGGGVQRSDDGGATWRPASSGLGNPFVNAVTVDPHNPDVVYAATQQGFYRSADGGASWLGAPGLNGRKVHAVGVNPAQPQILFVGTDKGLFRSDDGGAHLQLMTVGLPPPASFNFEVLAVAVDPLHPRQVYISHIGIHNGIHKTVNGGRVWVPQRFLTVDSIAVDPVHDSIVWAAGNDGVFRTANGGQQWTKVRAEPAHALAIDPFDSATVYAANAQDLQVTHDGGASWQRLPAVPSFGGALALAADPSTRGRLLAGTGGAGVYASGDEGNSWLASGQGLVNTGVNALAFEAASSGLFVGGQAGIFHSVDGGAHWNLTTFSGGAALAISSAPSAQNTLYAAIGGSEVVRTEDGGASWHTVSSLAAYSLAVTLKDPNRLYAVGIGALMKSIDGGVTWAPVFRGPVFDVAVDAVDPAVAYVLGDGGLWKSDDGGVTWLRLLTGHSLQALAVGRNSPRTMLAADSQSVFASFDSGASWSTLAGSRIEPLALAVDPRNPAIIYIGSNVVAEQSTDGGATFHLFNAGLFGRGLTKLLFDPNDPRRIYAGTSGAGVFVFDFAN